MDSVIALPELWVPVVAAFIPILTALAVKAENGTAVRAAIAIAASAILAVVEQVTADDASVEALIATFAIVVITQVAFYASVWKPLVNVNDRVAPGVGV